MFKSTIKDKRIKQVKEERKFASPSTYSLILCNETSLSKQSRNGRVKVSSKSNVYNGQKLKSANIMRPLFVVLVSIVALISLLALAYDSLEDDENSSLENGELQLNLIRYKNENQKFHRTERGFLNALNRQSIVLNGQLNATTGSGQANNETTSQPQQQHKLSLLTNMNYNYTNVKCHKNKFDRIIAQKMLINDISRPIRESSGSFENPFPTWKQFSYFDLIQLLIMESSESNIPIDKNELDKRMPILKPTFRSDNSTPGDFRVTWIGHSTLLIQIDGVNILTDPMFSQRASPSQYFGPKRYRDPACDIESLPNIDIVLISHNHFDHLDSASVRQLNDRFKTNLRWIVPLGVGAFMESMSVENYIELNWWQKDCFHTGNSLISINSSSSSSSSSNNNNNNNNNSTRKSKSQRLDLEIYFTPAQHWSGRGMTDMKKSLWGSYTILSPAGSSFFFTGDSGYCLAFKEISKIFGPFAGAAIPIGAYKPRWFMRPQHVDPLEAVQIHKDLRSSKSLAIHHGTFDLAYENYEEPSSLLRETMEANSNGLKEQPFMAIHHGESMEFISSK